MLLANLFPVGFDMMTDFVNRMQALNEYSFATSWVLDAPVDAVWDAMIETEQWPEWWPYLCSVTEIGKGNFDGTGSLLSFKWGNPPLQAFFFYHGNKDRTADTYRRQSKRRLGGYWALAHL
jgi:hypothetical protein